MGLFDGVPGRQGRTRRLGRYRRRDGLAGPARARRLAARRNRRPRCWRAAASYDPRVRIAGRHAEQGRLASATCGSSRDAGRTRRHSGASARCPADAALALPERHLGLVQASETQDIDALLDQLADLVAAQIDLDAFSHRRARRAREAALNRSARCRRRASASPSRRTRRSRSCIRICRRLAPGRSGAPVLLAAGR